MKILNIYTNQVIFEDDFEALRETVVNAIMLGAYLSGAYLSGAENIKSFQCGEYNRVSYAIKYKNETMFKIGCLWGNTEEAIAKVKEKYGENSDYEKYKSEAHYIYQKAYTGNDTISVYLNFYAATYSTRFGYVKDESALMSNAKIDLKLNDNSDYSVVKFTIPQDGSEYNKSIKEMFSNDVYAYYFGDNANNNDSI